MTIFAKAKAYMAATGNPRQWGPNYPSIDVIKEDITRGWSHVVEYDGRIAGTFCLMTDPEPSYSTLTEGRWVDTEGLPYATIHRIASDGTMPGVMTLACHYARKQGWRHLRCDTGLQNAAMHRALLAQGFTPRGLIWLGPEKGQRRAYDWLATDPSGLTGPEKA